MIHHRGHPAVRLTGLALIALLAFPMSALANTSDPIAQTGGMSATIPLLGSSLTVNMVLDSVGNISSVALNPVGDLSATRVGPHAVAFENVAGTTKIRIKARGDQLSIGATAGSLTALVGSGTWSADVFGTGLANVNYTIGNNAGAPTLAITSATAPAGITVTQGTPVTKTTGWGSSARVGVDFAANGFVKRLSISVSVFTGVPGGGAGAPAPQARLSITLTAKDRQTLTGSLASLLGAKSWSGRLCNGTAVGINFTIAADISGNGIATFNTATGATATAKVSDKGFTARFDGTRTMVKVRLVKNDAGTWTLKVSATTGKCRHDSAANPTVNTPTNLKPSKGGDRGGWWGGSGQGFGDRGGWWGGSWGGSGQGFGDRGGSWGGSWGDKGSAHKGSGDN